MEQACDLQTPPAPKLLPLVVLCVSSRWQGRHEAGRAGPGSGRNNRQSRLSQPTFTKDRQLEESSSIAVFLGSPPGALRVQCAVLRFVNPWHLGGWVCTPLRGTDRGHDECPLPRQVPGVPQSSSRSALLPCCSAASFLGSPRGADRHCLGLLGWPENAGPSLEVTDPSGPAKPSRGPALDLVRPVLKLKPPHYLRSRRN